MRSARLVIFSLFVFFTLPPLTQAADKIRFVTLEFAPFIYGEKQKVAGPGRDIIDAVCNEAKIQCSYDIYPWRRALESLKSGVVDAMMVIGRNPKREEWMRFSPPLFRTEYGIFVNAKNPLQFNNIADLEGYRIGAFAPSNTAIQLAGIRQQMIEQGLKPIKIDKRPDDASGFRKLAAGRIDAVYSNRDRGREILKAEKLTDKVKYAGGHQGIYYYTGFARTFADQALIDRFDAAWHALYDQGKVQEIIESYGLEPAVLEK